jgi:hypothetical protein
MTKHVYDLNPHLKPKPKTKADPKPTPKSKGRAKKNGQVKS